MNGSAAELTRAIAAGDTEALALLFRTRFDEMYSNARRATGRDESFCLDVVQDAMMRVIRSMKPLETEEHLRGWLRVAVQSCAYDRLRKEARLRRREEAAVHARAAEHPDDELREKLEWLRRELSTLEDPHAQMLVLRHRLGWTLERIGGAFGLKPGAVDGRVSRAVAALRRRAKETFHD